LPSRDPIPGGLGINAIDLPRWDETKLLKDLLQSYVSFGRAIRFFTGRSPQASNPRAALLLVSILNAIQ
jgi:hypothetical protein